MLPCFVAAVFERREKAGVGAARGCRTQLLLEKNIPSLTFVRGAEGGDTCLRAVGSTCGLRRS